MGVPGKISATLCATALGLFALYMTQVKVMGNAPSMGKVSKLCLAGNRTAVTEAGLHDYEPWTGGNFICILTQFALGLVEQPAGTLVWGAAAIHLFPLMLLIFTEAGRPGSKALCVRWPIFTLLTGQAFGISFAYPCFWVNSALWEGGGAGTPSKGRVVMAMLVPLLVGLVMVAVFTMDTHTRAWTICADIMVGPGLALTGMLMWPFPVPEKPDLGAIELLKTAYAIFAVVSAGLYYYLISYACRNYANLGQLLSAIWGPEASPWVAFMTIDSPVLSLSLLVYLAGTCRSSDVLLAVLCSPFIGPAAAYCMVLRSREQQRAESLAGAGEALLPS